METDGLPTPDNAIFGEIQVLLAEKRTALASLRTGIAVFALPLSRVVSFRSGPRRRAFGSAGLCAAGPRADLTEDRCRFREWALRGDAAKRRSLNLYRQFAPRRLPMRLLREVSLKRRCGNQ